MSVRFIEMLKPYEGKTYSGIKDGMELTYKERLQEGIKELEACLEEGENRLRKNVIQCPDFEYDDCFRSYFGMIIVNVEKGTGNITWWLRED